MHHWALLRRIAPLFSFQVLTPIDKFLLSLLSYWLKSPNSLSPISYQICSGPFINSVALCWNLSMSFLYWEPRTDYSTPGVTTPVLRGRITSLHLLALLFLVQARVCWPSLPQGCMAAHGQLVVYQVTKAFLCRGASQSASQHVLVPAAIPPQVQDFTFPHALHEFPVNPFLQPVSILLDANTTAGFLSRSSHLCAICKLAGSALCPSLH